MTDYTFAHMVDLTQVRQLLESHHGLTGMAYAILDTDENPLIAVGWQDICVRFHRINPVSCVRCRESDAYIRAHLREIEGDFLEYRCKNGMIDIAIPIVIDGEHLATFFTGQFFYDDDRPDMEYFLLQAEALDFDLEEYLKALERVPVLSREHVRGNILFLCDMVKVLAEMGLKNLKLARETEERKRAEQALLDKQQRLSDMAFELSMAEERERRRIATYLHDNIGQDLALARIKLGMLAKSSLTREETGILGNAREIIGGVIKSVRFLTHQISPPILDSAGLEAALKWLAKQVETDYSLRVLFKDDLSEKAVSKEIRTELYYAARELLINVAKHAETDTARVAVGRENDRIVIRVEDDGIGFNPDFIEENLTRGSGGFGLFNIRRRIIHLGGAFEVESSPGAGTRVTIGMPLAKKQAEGDQAEGDQAEG